MFTSIFSEFKAHYAARHEPENMRLLAQVYWRLLLSIALLMVVGVILFGIWEFFGVISNLDAANTTGGASPSTILDRNQLQNTISALQDRQHSMNEVQNSAIPDPSK